MTSEDSPAKPPPVIWWIRRDMRLRDNAALTAACHSGRPVLPVYIFDEFDERLGAAPRFRLERALAALGRSLTSVGNGVCLRRGLAADVLADLIRATGAQRIVSSKSYLPSEIDRDSALVALLEQTGCQVDWHNTRALVEPWTLRTGSGGPYRVFGPFWRALRQIDMGEILPAPAGIAAMDQPPSSATLSDWALSAGLRHSIGSLEASCEAGEDAAHARLTHLLDNTIAGYGAERDRPDLDATSGLSDYLALGEISARVIWHAGRRSMADGRPGAEPFLRQLAWRDFACHLAFHFPHILQSNWREKWDGFPWKTEISASVRAWQRGQTGVDLVDAGMRELWVTGRMHNRVRMVVASYLTKHLMTHWSVGAAWFADCLTDWDPASNALGWQWVAGSGPDAAPFFRIFNPERQRQTYDPDQTYVRRWIAEGQTDPPATALAYFSAQPNSWGYAPTDMRPEPAIGLAAGRKRALDAWKTSQNDHN